MRERSNHEWYADLANRDEAALIDLRDSLVRGLSRALAGRADANAAEDFAQDAIVRILDQLSTFRHDSKFFTWAMAIATRIAFSELRKARYRDVSLDGLTMPHPTGQDADIGKDEQHQRTLAALHQLIDTELTERQRLLIRAELAEIPQAVIAERMGMTRNALYKMGHDARMKLKNGLLALGITADEVRILLDHASNV